ncbi:hypothetical protein Lfu02_73700 [Longispora fulva]|uniref:Uncharacterized protein n=1 Tax=Longispora fulva TaxID=619741 RepID=A0A8J7KFX5_9ACTN|nr:hypothetical protein [Longispora fulva]MBG6134284.1 hypothetical protein [Longispora fulva]GIG62998.1 hypothetical protein Lfu02_73700 [Longispora fulva]
MGIVRLSELLGRPVPATRSRITDLVAPLGADQLAVRAAGLGHRTRVSDWVRWPDLRSPAPEPVPGELRLVRDLLDGQVFDIAGNRLVRVGDVLFEEDGDLLLVGVEVGAASVWRRLGLRRVADHLPTTVIEWPDLHPATGAGLAHHLAANPAALHQLTAPQLATLTSGLATHHAAMVLDHLPPAHAEAVLGHLHPSRAAALTRLRNLLL